MPKRAARFPDTATMVFCIGAQKAGTTWLYEALRASPQVHFCRNKELHYFDVMAGRADLAIANRVKMAAALANKLTAKTGPGNAKVLKQLREVTDLLTIYTGEPGDHDPYLRYLLRGYRAQPVVCDITPAYAILDAPHFADMASIGTAKFLFLLRDPVDRMWSQIRMAEAVEHPDVPKGDAFDAACAARAKMLIEAGRLPRIERADYERTIRALEKVIPRDRIKYVFYEDLFAPETLDDICGFLDIDAIQADGARRSNPGRDAAIPDDIRHGFERAFARQYKFVRKRFGDRVPTAWHSAQRA
ncbi:sulfotransferase [Tateyamaria omphalii]|uniref:sulfotransferase n=1 Tax=Tateyamaria omphalii TaxID=299262 RepID=UPI001C99F320|nr:sulfotransferase [Tateyamaria omphalii]MBY5935554.1 sulfotransferase [Tateyamaria omphalii]